jgi:hypothetical protein
MGSCTLRMYIATMTILSEPHKKGRVYGKEELTGD